MQRTTDDTNPESGYDETAPPDTESFIPRPRAARTTPGRGKAAITDIRVARIETVTMTATEYADAVEALAVLISRYERDPAQPHTAA